MGRPFCQLTQKCMSKSLRERGRWGDREGGGGERERERERGERERERERKKERKREREREREREIASNTVFSSTHLRKAAIIRMVTEDFP